MRAAHSTTTTRPSGAAISCGNAIPVSSPSALHGVGRDALRLLELVAVDRRRVDVDPADAEADARRAQPVGERQRDRLAAARDHDPVHLGARRRTPRGSPRPSATIDERLVQVRLDVVERLDAEDAALPARVGGLQHRRERRPRRARGAARDSVRSAAKRGCGTPGVGEPAPHRDLVRHQVRRLDADPGQAERLGDRGDDRDGAVGRDRQHAVDLQPARPPSAPRRRRRSRRPSRCRPPRARARPGCGRPRRRAARAPSRAGSRAAGGGRRRRRGRSSRALRCYGADVVGLLPERRSPAAGRGCCRCSGRSRTRWSSPSTTVPTCACSPQPPRSPTGCSSSPTPIRRSARSSGFTSRRPATGSSGSTTTRPRRRRCSSCWPRRRRCRQRVRSPALALAGRLARLLPVAAGLAAAARPARRGRFPGLMHVPVRGGGTARYVEAPLYHLDLLALGP